MGKTNNTELLLFFLLLIIFCGLSLYGILKIINKEGAEDVDNHNYY